MIKKNRPQWQTGLYNAIGGHAEVNETALDTLIREFCEETGVITVESDWSLFAILTGKEFCLNFFVTNKVDLSLLKTTTDEEIVILDANDLNPSNSIVNISWLIKMAQTIYLDRTNYFVINER